MNGVCSTSGRWRTPVATHDQVVGRALRPAAGRIAAAGDASEQLATADGGPGTQMVVATGRSCSLHLAACSPRTGEPRSLHG